MFMCSYLNVLQVYFDQADLVRLGQQLDACDAAELGEGGQDAELVVDHLAHPIPGPHQQGHHRLPVLELVVYLTKKQTRTDYRTRDDRNLGRPDLRDLPSWWR